MARKRIHPQSLCVDCGVDVKHPKTKRCKTCRDIYLSETKEQRDIDRKKYMSEWFEKNRESQRIKAAERWSKLPYLKRKEYIIRHKYNIEIDKYYQLLDEQNNRCKICNKLESEFGKLCVDHCHETNIVRGLLCQKCNAGIGLLGDSIDILQNAVDYLKTNR